MYRVIQPRESDNLQRPDYSFIRDSVIGLEKEKRCYAYWKWQADEIQRLYKIKHKEEICCKFNKWYYEIWICNT